MTEQEIAESLTGRRAVEGIELAEQIMLDEYDSAYSDWNSSDEGSVETVNKIEQSLVALRVARELLSSGVFDDEMLQGLATQVPCEDADIESLEETAEVVQSMLSEETEMESGAWSPSAGNIG